jgi:16S rRNA (adenine1518-N6/adenine1519-N6)-dimethyltransferase
MTNKFMVSIRKELAEYGLAPRKKWGQHFLADRNILRKVIRTAGVTAEDTVLEVGPGLGEMTLALAQKARRVIAVEIDRKLIAILRKKIEGRENVEVIEGDILKMDFSRFLHGEQGGIKVVANLPYQISTPLLFRFIESRHLFSTLTLMVQREVAERIVAPPETKAYGPLSIFIQSFANVSIRFFLKKTVFVPPPKVESAVIQVAWRERPLVETEIEEWFKKLVRSCFSYRRKTVFNALRHSGLPLPPDIEERIRGRGIDPGRRPGTLSIQEFIEAAKALKS